MVFGKGGLSPPANENMYRFVSHSKSLRYTSIPTILSIHSTGVSFNLYHSCRFFVNRGHESKHHGFYDMYATLLYSWRRYDFPPDLSVWLNFKLPRTAAVRHFDDAS